MRRVVASAPGKLFLAGEYAVTEPGRPAVSIAVDRRLTLTLVSAKCRTGLAREGRYVRSVVRVMDALAQVAGRDGGPYAVSSRSTLVDPAIGERPKRKYGLGSSSAVTAAAVRALEVWHGLSLTPEERLRAALLATLRVSPTASGGDVATALTGGWVTYRSPDRAWVLARDRGGFDPERLEPEPDPDPGSTAALVAADWPGLRVAALPAPRTIEVRVGWSGAPMTTATIVRAVRSHGIGRTFLAESDAAAEALRAAVEADDVTGAQAAIRGARAALLALSRTVGVEIETPLLAELADLAERHGYAGKSSGAGGGDCGVALGAREASGGAGAALEAAWEARGITPLHLGLGHGAEVSVSGFESPGEADSGASCTAHERVGGHDA